MKQRYKQKREINLTAEQEKSETQTNKSLEPEKIKKFISQSQDLSNDKNEAIANIKENNFNIIQQKVNISGVLTNHQIEKEEFTKNSSLSQSKKVIDKKTAAKIIQAAFRGYEYRKRNRKINKNKNSAQIRPQKRTLEKIQSPSTKSIIYKRKTPIKTKKGSLYFRKGNHNSYKSYNGYNTAKLKNTNLFKISEINKKNSNFGEKIQKIFNIKRKIKNNMCMHITKNHIVNKKYEMSMIEYIQEYWKELKNKVSIIRQFKPLIFDMKDLPPKATRSFLLERNKPFQNIITNISNISNNINSILSYNDKEDPEINDYENDYNINFIPPYLRTNISTRPRNNSINEFEMYKVNPKTPNYKSYHFLKNNRNSSKDYNMKPPKLMRINETVNENNNYERYNDIKFINNNLNIWKKQKLKCNYQPHSIDKYKSLIPNKNFIYIDSKKKEKEINLDNNRENIIPKPHVFKMKKTRNKSNFKIKTSTSSSLIENSNNNLSIKSSLSESRRKIKKRQIIISQFFIDDFESIEPPLALEIKLTMGKPHIHKPKKKVKKKIKKIYRNK